jgi:hypothetical protein
VAQEAAEVVAVEAGLESEVDPDSEGLELDLSLAAGSGLPFELGLSEVLARLSVR